MWHEDSKVSTVGELRQALEGFPDDTPIVKTQRRRGDPGRGGVRHVVLLINSISLVNGARRAFCLRLRALGLDDQIKIH